MVCRSGWADSSSAVIGGVGGTAVFCMLSVLLSILLFLFRFCLAGSCELLLMVSGEGSSMWEEGIFVVEEAGDGRGTSAACIVSRKYCSATRAFTYHCFCPHSLQRSSFPEQC